MVQMHSQTSTPFNDAIRDGRGAPEMYDGVAELWWDSLDDIAAATARPDGQAAGAALLEDERKFIDLARSPLFLGAGEAHLRLEDGVRPGRRAWDRDKASFKPATLI